MIKFEKIFEGMTLWDVRKSRVLTSFRSKWDIWPVYIKGIDREKRRVYASWNNNRYEWISERNVTRFKIKLPSDYLRQK